MHQAFDTSPASTVLVRRWIREVMPEPQVLLPPFEATRVEQTLRRLRITPLLDAVRGEPPLDVEACCAAVMVGVLMAESELGMAQLDINR